jgi:hypothetical protein
MKTITNVNLSSPRTFQTSDFDTHCGVEGACRLHFPFFPFEISIGAIALSPKKLEYLANILQLV